MTHKVRDVGLATLVAAVSLVAGVSLGGPSKQAATRYMVSGDEFEGCECNSVCQCIWSHDATFDQCRGIAAWTVKRGDFAGTGLKGLTFAAVITKSGKNMDASMGQWEGVLFVPDTATPAQQEAIHGLMQAEMGPAFAKMEVRAVPITLSGEPGEQELHIGDIGHLKVAAVRGPNGQVPKIMGAPSPLALPVEYVATAAANTYNDGTTSWDFQGRNSFYGPFVMKTKP